ncbi:3-ketoacyl-CoA thiolase domain protein [Mycobacterium kansasii]|uniref:3-ketoacyl-CoA thiolase domain protein n=1 Tax=Mycobacterium kansasii TaxID=1768 RepID=A0A1V3XI80_MYCKA|nr:3-ketoacyl-CoA thiolase domain protein [Mycobacterium kansasii]
MRQKLERAAHDPYVLPHVRSAVLDALRRAQVSLDDVDGFEVHDCFTPSEYLAIDHIGLTGRANRGRRSKTARSRSAGGCRSTPAVG